MKIYTWSLHKYHVDGFAVQLHEYNLNYMYMFMGNLWKLHTYAFHVLIFVTVKFICFMKWNKISFLEFQKLEALTPNILGV